MYTYNDICVVVRACGERTTTGSIKLLEDIFEPGQVLLSEAVPFSKAIENAFNLGIKSKKKWLLCIDADVLISRKGIFNLVEKAFESPDEYFQIQGLVADKFFNCIRPAGNHMYRIKYAGLANGMIPEEGASLRPETDMLNRMAEAGYPWMQCDAIVGVHDYEQYYADIYRKCFLQAHKHDWVLPLAEKHWSLNKTTDKDYLVALWGAFHGRLHTGTVFVDKTFLENQATNFLHSLDLPEKEALHNFDPKNVETLIDLTVQNAESELQNRIFPKRSWNSVKRNEPKIKKDKIINKIGKLFCRIGKKLQSV